MSYMRKDSNGNFVDVDTARRKDSSGNFVDCEFVRRKASDGNWIDVWDFLSIKPYVVGLPTGIRTLSGNGAVIEATGATAQFNKFGVASSKALSVGDVVEVTYNNVTGALGYGGGKVWAMEGFVGASNFLLVTSTVTTQKTATFTATEAATLRLALTYQSTILTSIPSASMQIIDVKINGKTVPFRLS